MLISSVVVVETPCDTTLGQGTVTIANASTLNLSYAWSVPNTNGPSLVGVGPGVYSVTITNLDQPSCNIIEEFSIGSSNGPEVTYESTPSLCGTTNGTVTFASPNPNLIYDWSYGPGNTAIDVAAGTYFVTITDPADPDCIDIKTIVVDEMPSFEVSYAVNASPDCAASNGSVTITPSTPGDYTYSWGNSTADNLSAGIYEVTVTDIMLQVVLQLPLLF